MARQKATIMLDRAKADEARGLVGADSASDVVDMALDRLIRAERLRRDVIAYKSQPQVPGDLVLGDLAVELDLGDEDVDYDALYATNG